MGMVNLHIFNSWNSCEVDCQNLQGNLLLQLCSNLACYLMLVHGQPLEDLPTKTVRHAKLLTRHHLEAREFVISLLKKKNVFNLDLTYFTSSSPKYVQLCLNWASITKLLNSNLRLCATESPQSAKRDKGV